MAGDRPLTETDLYQYIQRTPELAQHYDPRSWLQNQPAPLTDNQSYSRILGEAAAMADPFGIMAIRRMFGDDNLPPKFLINESHGLAGKQNDQYRAIAKALTAK